MTDKEGLPPNFNAINVFALDIDDSLAFNGEGIDLSHDLGEDGFGSIIYKGQIDEEGKPHGVGRMVTSGYATEDTNNDENGKEESYFFLVGDG